MKGVLSEKAKSPYTLEYCCPIELAAVMEVVHICSIQ